MSANAWFWLFVVILVFWLAPIALFFYQPKREMTGLEEWGAIPYAHLKFDRKWEVRVVAGISLLTGWLFWAAVRAGLLVWK